MKLIADICVIPIGVGTSVSSYVAACQSIFANHGLICQLHANGTNVEGPWDVVMAALRQCHEQMHEMGAPRVATSVRLGTRNDRVQSMQDKVDSVRHKVRD